MAAREAGTRGAVLFEAVGTLYNLPVIASCKRCKLILGLLRWCHCGECRRDFHWLDIGGNVPGGFNSRATESFQEGVRFPPIKKRVFFL